jgi:hypothetical protein
VNKRAIFGGFDIFLAVITCAAVLSEKGQFCIFRIDPNQ